MSPLKTILSVAATLFLLAACGGADSGTADPGAGGDVGDDSTTDDGAIEPGDDGSGGAASGACLEGTPDCVDADLGGGDGAEPDLDDSFDADVAVENARSLLGEPEDEVLELWQNTRLGRHGDEQMMLTEDYVLGRMTIETEDDGTGTYRVVEVTVELPDGPVSVTE